MTDKSPNLVRDLPPEFDEAGKFAMREKAKLSAAADAESFGFMSDEWVADRVRMLMRNELFHEAICVAARDRIMRLSLRVAELERGLAPETDEVMRLRESLARWESPDNWGAFVELLDLPPDHLNKPLGVAAGIALLKGKLDRYMKALQTANGFLIMNNLEPVKLEYGTAEKAVEPKVAQQDSTGMADLIELGEVVELSEGESVLGCVPGQMAKLDRRFPAGTKIFAQLPSPLKANEARAHWPGCGTNEGRPCDCNWERLAAQKTADACPRCGGELKPGQAMQSTLVASLPDFPGQTDMTGQTVSSGGPGRLVDVLKCIGCGYSHTTTLKGAELRQVPRNGEPQ